MLLLLLAVPAPAQQEDCRAKARSFQGLPPLLGVEVVARNDSDFNLELADALRQALEAAGHSVTKDGAFELLFDSAVMPGDFSEDPPSLGRAEIGSGDGRAEINIWSNERDSLLGGRVDKKKPDSARANHFRIDLRLLRRSDGARLWEGDFRCGLHLQDHSALAKAMAPPIAERFGRNAADDPFVVNP